MTGQNLPTVVRRQDMKALIPQTFDEIERFANWVVEGGWAPRSYMVKNLKTNRMEYNHSAIKLCIAHGLEVGFTPLAALQSIAVINGMPSIWGDGLLALCRASGDWEYMKQGFEGEGMERYAWCEVKRRSDGEPMRQTFSMAQAKQAGLLNKGGTWHSYPDRMLQMRPRSWCLRDAYADILRGLHVAEEVIDTQNLVLQEDGSFAPATEEAPASSGPGTAAMRPTAAPEEEVQDAEIVDEPPVDDKDEGYYMLNLSGTEDGPMSARIFGEKLVAGCRDAGSYKNIRAFMEDNQEMIARFKESSYEFAQEDLGDCDRIEEDVYQQELDAAHEAEQVRRAEEAQQAFQAEKTKTQVEEIAGREGYPLYDSEGAVKKTYVTATNFYKALKNGIPDADDPRRFVESNRKTHNRIKVEDEELARAQWELVATAAKLAIKKANDGQLML